MKRCLNALGGVSGLARFTNDAEALKEIKLNLKFAASLEEYKATEKQIKAARVKANHAKFYLSARKKCKLAVTEKFFASHAKKLTIKECAAVAFTDCGGVVLRGRLQNVRTKLETSLPVRQHIPEYPTQDEVFSDECSSSCAEDEDAGDSDSEGADIQIRLTLDDVTVGEGVEVYWPGDKLWYKGVVLKKDPRDKTFFVQYVSDGAKLWHSIKDFQVRVSC